MYILCIYIYIYIMIYAYQLVTGGFLFIVGGAMNGGMVLPRKSSKSQGHWNIDPGTVIMNGVYRGLYYPVT